MNPPRVPLNTATSPHPRTVRIPAEDGKTPSKGPFVGDVPATRRPKGTTAGSTNHSALFNYTWEMGNSTEHGARVRTYNVRLAAEDGIGSGLEAITIYPALDYSEELDEADNKLYGFQEGQVYVFGTLEDVERRDCALFGCVSQITGASNSLTG
ncbi:hypothetical protein Trydic_g12826 [Trypoxylus dichotomus]